MQALPPMRAMDRQESPKPAKPGKRRIVRYDEMRTSQKKLIKSAKSTKKHRNEQDIVLIIRRVIDHKGRHVDTKIDIKSEVIATLLREINQGVTGLTLTNKPPVAEMSLFYHCQYALQERFQQVKEQADPSDDLSMDLAVVLDFIQEEFGGLLSNMDSLVSHGDITWELMWALFPPNILVYHYHEFTEQVQVLRFKSMTICHRPDMTSCWNFVCTITADDGNSFGASIEPLALQIDKFDGSRKILDLLLFPLKYHQDAEGIRAMALERGKRYSAISKPYPMETSGPAMGEKPDPLGRPTKYKFNTHGRAMVDAAAYRAFNPNDLMMPRVYRRLERNKLSDEQLIITTPVALGFSLGDKKWGGFAMTRLAEIEWNDEAFRSLVMEKKTKTLVHSLVKQHSSKRGDDYDDVVTGKGKGLISLMCGPPGTGKTLTAKAVAELTRRPLYTVSAGELGVAPTEVDERLTLVMELAEKWDAVMLLDEADVFLQRRSSTDVKRNALVSIFLRHMEYFQGILMLTTNRVEEHDAAFESRVHITLHYPELDEQARREVWHTFLGRARGKGGLMKVAVSADEVNLLAKSEINGRQIKNVVSGARAIAREMGQPLDISHIQAVLDVTMQARQQN